MITNPVDTQMLNTKIAENTLKNMNVKTADQKKLIETCKEFESIFIKQMLNSMKTTVHKSGLIKESMGEGIFEDMLYDKYAQKISRTGNLGIAEMIYKQLSTQLDSTKPAEIQ